MKSSAIRHLTASRRSTRVAAGFFENTVQIWELQKLEMVAQFRTVLSFGGNRLALDALGERCVAASWEDGPHGGVACYEAKSGALLWQRSDLKETQRVRFTATGDAIWCVPSNGPTKRLDPLTGKTLDALTVLADIYDSPYSSSILVEKKKGDHILKNGGETRIPRLTFGILDAVFSRDAVCISEAGGPVRCVESIGVERWRHNPGMSQHLLRLWHRAVDDQFYGIRWEYAKGSFRTLVRLDARSGECVDICQLDSWAEEVCGTLNCLLTSHGQVINLENGELLSRVPFPQTGYPDVPKDSGIPHV
jgi:hypothetical protein